MSEPKFSSTNKSNNDKLQNTNSSNLSSDSSKKITTKTDSYVNPPKASHDNSQKWKSNLNVKTNDSPLHKLNAHLIEKDTKEAKPN